MNRAFGVVGLSALLLFYAQRVASAEDSSDEHASRLQFENDLAAADLGYKTETPLVLQGDPKPLPDLEGDALEFYQAHAGLYVDKSLYDSGS
jgi:hypothetical protein